MGQLSISGLIVINRNDPFKHVFSLVIGDLGHNCSIICATYFDTVIHGSADPGCGVRSLVVGIDQSGSISTDHDPTYIFSGRTGIADDIGVEEPACADKVPSSDVPVIGFALAIFK